MVKEDAVKAPAAEFAAIAENVCVDVPRLPPTEMRPLDKYNPNTYRPKIERRFIERVKESTVEAFTEASALPGGNDPVDATNPSFLNATSAIQRVARPYDAEEIKWAQTAVAELSKSSFRFAYNASSMEENPSRDDLNLQVLVDLALSTLKDSTGWVSDRWKPALSEIKVASITILEESFRKRVVELGSGSEFEPDFHYDLPNDGVNLFLEIPGDAGTVVPLHQCTMTRASMAAGGRLYHELREKNIPIEFLKDEVIDFRSSPGQFFSCPEPVAQRHMSVSLVDMFNPVHRQQQNPMGTLVRIVFDDTKSTCFSLAPEFFPERRLVQTEPPNGWPANSLATWYAIAHRKIEELASMYNNKISAELIKSGVGAWSSSAKYTKLRELMQQHEKANECLVMLGYEPQLLEGIDDFLDPATAPSRPPNLRSGVVNDKLTQELIIRNLATQMPCTLLDVAC